MFCLNICLQISLFENSLNFCLMTVLFVELYLFLLDLECSINYWTQTKIKLIYVLNILFAYQKSVLCLVDWFSGSCENPEKGRVKKIVKYLI